MVGIVFKGEYQHNIDAKGRIIVPAKFRDGLGESFVITKGLDHCLCAYPMKEWEIFEEKLKLLPSKAIKIVRFFTSGAADCEFDNQGRIMIPPNLREYAKLEKEIVSIGVVNKIEIWNRPNWIKYNDEDNFVDNELSGIMENMGI